MDKNLKKNIGLRIKHTRLELDLTQEELSEMLGCHRSLIGHFETAKTPPSLNLQHLLSSKYNVSIDWIIRGTGSMFIIDAQHEDDVQEMLSDFSKSAALKHRMLGDYFSIRDKYLSKQNVKGNGNECK
ncbi:MAG: helix-turn-helix transcriptional regulator [bacterium]|nr:helix-turn-helix transcriptional regulator [bacterium]